MQFPQEDQIVLLKAGMRAVVETYYLILNSIVNCFIFRELWACNHTDEPLLWSVQQPRLIHRWPQPDAGEVLHAAPGGLHHIRQHRGDDAGQSNLRLRQVSGWTETVWGRIVIVFRLHSPPSRWDLMKLSSQTTFNLSISFSDRPGIRNVDEIRKLNEAVGNSLQKELMSSQALQQIKEEIPAINLLINKRHTLRYETVVTIGRRYLRLKYFSGI